MEKSVSQYVVPYDPLRPLMCFDERPCFLIGQVGAILPLSPGTAQCYHYEYEKHGSCCVFLAFESHTGLRYVEVRARRTAVDYAEFMQNLLAKHYPQVECIRLVQDNLNTHTPGAFYEVLPLGAAFELSQRFESHYTPLKGAWLNRAEIAFAALAAQCLNRRIPHDDILRQEVLAWTAQRHRQHKAVNWKFSQNDGPRSWRRPLSATQHDSTTSLVGISFHCHET